MQKGFTLLELLLVCAIIGIMGAVGFNLFSRASNIAQVNEASAQLSADFQRARSSAQRSNNDAKLAFSITTGATSYTLTVDGQALTRTLPAGVQVAVSPTSAKTITYKAPFGEVIPTSTTAVTYTLTSQRDSALVRYLRIVGLTGKVYASERGASG